MDSWHYSRTQCCHPTPLGRDLCWSVDATGVALVVLVALAASEAAKEATVERAR